VPAANPDATVTFPVGVPNSPRIALSHAPWPTSFTCSLPVAGWNAKRKGFRRPQRYVSWQIGPAAAGPALHRAVPAPRNGLSGGREPRTCGHRINSADYGLNQFSTSRPEIRLKWFSLFVTTVRPWTSAEAAMRTSASPIGSPRRRSSA